jgi:hypothetical protein
MGLFRLGAKRALENGGSMDDFAFNVQTVK